jgi:protein SCO1
MTEPRKRLTLLFAAAISLLIACEQPAPQKKLRDVGAFTLVDHDGRVFRSASLKGRPALLFFGFTHCPDACPTMMSRVARAYRLAGADARGIPTLFVSVDPRDTPPVLKRYLSYFSAVPATGLTGSKAQIDEVVRQFGATYQIRDTGSAAGPMVDHTIRLYLLDRDGDVVRLFDPSTDVKEIAEAMRDI